MDGFRIWRLHHGQLIVMAANLDYSRAEAIRKLLAAAGYRVFVFMVGVERDMIKRVLKDAGIGAANSGHE